MAAGLAALLQITLVVILRWIEGRCRRDLGDDSAAVFQLLRLKGGGRGRLLLRIGEEDGRTVLRPDVPALPVFCRGIVDPPKRIEQEFVGDFSRIVFDPDGFGVAGPAGADLLVAGRISGASCVAHGGRGHARDLAKCGLDGPEAAGSKDSGPTHAYCNRARA